MAATADHILFSILFFCHQSGVSLSAPSLKLMQNIFPSSVQYNTTVSGNNRLKEGILLVDDDRQRLEKTQSLLRQHFIVYSVNNDDEALDFLEHSIKNVNNDNEISLIIISIDVIGDHINGWGFLNTLWSSEEFKDIPVIALASSLSLELNKSKIWEVHNNIIDMNHFYSYNIIAGLLVSFSFFIVVVYVSNDVDDDAIIVF